MIEMDFPEVFIGLCVCGDVGLDRSPNRRPAPSHLEQGRESLRPAGGSPAKYLGRCRASRAARPYFSEEHFVPLAHLALAPCPPPRSVPDCPVGVCVEREKLMRKPRQARRRDFLPL